MFRFLVQVLRDVDERLRDLAMVISRTHDYRKGRLEQLSEHLEAWNTNVLHEKAVFHTVCTRSSFLCAHSEGI